MIYFDHNATTPIDERVIEAMLPYLQTFYGNPSSLYRMGRVVKSAIETAREQVATLVGTQATQIIFTSGGTEANNLALRVAPAHHSIAISSIEHPSIIEPAIKGKSKDTLSFIPVNQDGIVQASSLENLLHQAIPPSFISVMLANNENGAIQDIKSLTDAIGDQNIVFHTDATQAVGKIPVSFDDLQVNLMSLSSHKLYGPKGSGALVVDNLSSIDPMLVGGSQENALRSGTENVAAIVGFGKAAELALAELDQRSDHLLKLRQYLEQELHSISGLVIFSEHINRLPNTVQFGIQGVDGEMLLMQLDQKNIAVSSGSACSSGGGQLSPVLVAMGIEPALAKSSIRISLGKMNTLEEIKQFITQLNAFVIKNKRE